MENLYGWWFTYNPYKEVWHACKGEDIPQVYNNHGSERVVSSDSIQTLIELITRAQGELEKVGGFIK